MLMHGYSRKRSNGLSTLATVVAQFSDCRQNRRLLPNFATVAVFGNSRRFRRQIELGDHSLQCGQAFRRCVKTYLPVAFYSSSVYGPTVKSRYKYMFGLPVFAQNDFLNVYLHCAVHVTTKLLNYTGDNAQVTNRNC